MHDDDFSIPLSDIQAPRRHIIMQGTRLPHQRFRHVADEIQRRVEYDDPADACVRHEQEVVGVRDHVERIRQSRVLAARSQEFAGAADMEHSAGLGVDVQDGVQVVLQLNAVKRADDRVAIRLQLRQHVQFTQTFAVFAANELQRFGDTVWVGAYEQQIGTAGHCHG